MARFHIHIYDSDIVPDIEGRDFADLSEALSEAMRGGRAIIAEQVASGETVNLDDRLEIVDGSEELKAVILFGDMISIVERRAGGPGRA